MCSYQDTFGWQGNNPCLKYFRLQLTWFKTTLLGRLGECSLMCSSVGRGKAGCQGQIGMDSSTARRFSPLPWLLFLELGVYSLFLQSSCLFMPSRIATTSSHVLPLPILPLKRNCPFLSSNLKNSGRRSVTFHGPYAYPWLKHSLSLLSVFLEN